MLSISIQAAYGPIRNPPIKAMNHKKLIANLKPQTALSISEKTAMEKKSKSTQERWENPHLREKY